MSYTIVPAEGGDYIVTTVVGEMTRDFATELAIEANAVAAPLGIRCFLWDATQSRNVESAFGNYKSTHSDLRATPEIDRFACVAVLVDKHDSSHDFYEALAQTAGLDVTLFRDREEAISHLVKRAASFRAMESPDAM